MFKIIKKVIFSLFLLYGFNLISVNFNLMIPINYITAGIVVLFGCPGLFLLVLFYYLVLWGGLMKPVLEGLLFLVGEEGISMESIADILEISGEETSDLLESLSNDYESENRGICLKKLGGVYKLTTKNEHKKYYSKLAEITNMKNLSQSALETLAIIAYNEPITRAEVDELRGVNSAQMIRNLIARDFVKEVGKSDKLGRPYLYGITSQFLDYFGLDSKENLPKIEEISVDEEEIDLYESKYVEEEKIEQL